MLEETLHAAHWWIERIISYHINVESPSWQSHFELVMAELLRAKYQGHWHKNDPTRGSGYRAISNEYALDPILDKAAKAVSHSLPKNLERNVLTSDDRWLVMFVNPGEVIVRDKKFHEQVVYDAKRHVYNKSLRLKHAVSSNKISKLSKLSELAATASASSATTLSPTTATSALSKSDGEEDEKQQPLLDYRQVFLQNIHKVAQRNKEKELEAHVQAYRIELRRHHDESEMWKHRKSPSKSSSASNSAHNTTSSSSAHSQQNSPMKASTATTHKKKTAHENANANTNTVTATTTDNSNNTMASSSTPPSPPPTATLMENSHAHTTIHTNPNVTRVHATTATDTSHSSNRITSGVGVLPMASLQLLNMFAGRDYASNSNCGKHLTQILNACQIQDRSASTAKHKNGHCNGHDSRQCESNDDAHNQCQDDDDDDGSRHHDYVVQHGEYPMLFPLTYASPSPSVSASMEDLWQINEDNITPLYGPIIDSLADAHDHDPDDDDEEDDGELECEHTLRDTPQPQCLTPSKSQPVSGHHDHREHSRHDAHTRDRDHHHQHNHNTIHRTKSTGNLPNVLYNESSDDEEEDEDDDHYRVRQRQHQHAQRRMNGKTKTAAATDVFTSLDISLPYGNSKLNTDAYAAHTDSVSSHVPSNENASLSSHDSKF
eukprot:CAMPEP_0202727028 /NCGR_PEP_ID=MMETSP1385-20130828/184913_1 /ASSEMBLY_ACC=CAM_ASM_000861 /TAXON_ID=933848 /ORGANISM="Elphidium margaritaceum" /LENGTH=660 /DNA_ID=CAMNT_0049393261 /DNA_START=70 /DNA_END=2052 /DNA_ORIENTATION=-